jgi:hypothetical protein
MKPKKPVSGKRAAASRRSRKTAAALKPSSDEASAEGKGGALEIRKAPQRIARRARRVSSSKAGSAAGTARRKSGGAAEAGEEVKPSPRKRLRAVAKVKVRVRTSRSRTAAPGAAMPAEGTDPARAASAVARVAIPPILLESDRPAAVPASGPGRRYALGPVAPAERFEAEVELPETYGTGQLLLAARDPHWLYAHWDLSLEQQRHYNALSVDRHLVLRVFMESAGGRPFTVVHLHPESRHWFVHVGRGGTRFTCELGYYARDGRWTGISVSRPTMTPPDAASEETAVEFATIPMDLPMPRLVALVKESVRENVPLASALEEMRSQGHPELPARIAGPPAEWTPAQEQALARVISMDHVRRVWMGSLEITELIRRRLVQELASAAAAQFGFPTSPAGAPGGISSPLPGGPEARGFWFNVNAELVVYGATEPGASVTIGERPIRLRSDGSFSYRFSLPDGRYELPVVAVAADQTDARAAELRFSRATEYRGDVGAHPQDPALPEPAPENL